MVVIRTQPDTMILSRQVWKKISLTVLILALLGLVGTPSASAHTYLEHSTPQDGEKVQEALKTITLVYNSTVKEVLNFNLSDENGEEIEVADVASNGEELTISLKEPLSSGHYSAEWEIVSEDGHVLDGSISFDVNWDPPQETETLPQPDRTETDEGQDDPSHQTPESAPSPAQTVKGSADPAEADEETSPVENTDRSDSSASLSPVKAYWPWLLAGIILCFVVGLIYYWRRHRT